MPVTKKLILKLLSRFGKRIVEAHKLGVDGYFFLMNILKYLFSVYVKKKMTKKERSTKRQSSSSRWAFAG